MLPVLIPNMGSISSYIKMLFKIKTSHFSLGAVDEVSLRFAHLPARWGGASRGDAMVVLSGSLLFCELC